MRRLLSFVLLVSATASAGAQIVRPRFPSREPSAWVSLGIGSQDGLRVTDGSTNSIWEIGNSTPWVVGIDKPIGGGSVAVGLMGTTAKVSMYYTGSGALGGGTDADANVSQGFLTLRTGGSSRAFHSLLEAGVGGTVYSNFRSRSGTLAIGPTSPDADFAFFLGYGFGYNFTPRFGVDIAQRMTTTLHQKDGLSASADASTRTGTVEIIGRVGLGGR